MQPSPPGYAAVLVTARQPPLVSTSAKPSVPCAPMRLLPHQLSTSGTSGAPAPHSIDAAHAVGELDEAADVIGRRVIVGELAAARGLRHHPLGVGVRR